MFLPATLPSYFCWGPVQLGSGTFPLTSRKFKLNPLQWQIPIGKWENSCPLRATIMFMWDSVKLSLTLLLQMIDLRYFNSTLHYYLQLHYSTCLPFIHTCFYQILFLFIPEPDHLFTFLGSLPPAHYCHWTFHQLQTSQSMGLLFDLIYQPFHHHGNLPPSFWTHLSLTLHISPNCITVLHHPHIFHYSCLNKVTFMNQTTKHSTLINHFQ